MVAQYVVVVHPYWMARTVHLALQSPVVAAPAFHDTVELLDGTRHRTVADLLGQSAQVMSEVILVEKVYLAAAVFGRSDALAGIASDVLVQYLVHSFPLKCCDAVIAGPFAGI